MSRLPSLGLPSLGLISALLAAMVASPVLSSTEAIAAADDPKPTTADMRLGPSGLPLPRFVSLKSGKVNSRIGPGINYAVDWLYMKPGLPMEVIQEYDNWRRVRDADGSEGWVLQSLLSGRRTGIAAPWQKGKETTIELKAQPQDSARVVAIVEPGAIGTIRNCDGKWCEMSFGGRAGWMAQSQVWGAYPGELVKD